MEKVISKKNIGSLIKFKRLEKNMTQKDLSDGICTTSYLSKIENDFVVADEEIYTLLFKRLELNYDSLQDLQQENIEINQRIEKWYWSLIEGKNDIKENIYGLKEDSRISSELAIKFEIAYSRYLLKINEMEKAEIIIKNLQETIKPDDGRNFFLLSNVLIFYYYLKGEYTNSLSIGLNLFKYKDKLFVREYEFANTYYYIALNYRKLYLYDMCIIYSNIALDIFDSHYDFKNSLRCHMLKGISFNNLGYFKNALKSYTLAMKLLEQLPEEERISYKGKLLNNIGYSYEKGKDYLNALINYKESLEITNDPVERIRIIINLVRCSLENKDKNSSKQWLQLGLDLVNENTPKQFLYQMKVYSLIHKENVNLKEIVELQTESITYFKKESLWQLVYDYSLIFARLYENISQYKKANNMHKNALYAFNKINKRRENSETILDYSNHNSWIIKSYYK